MGIRGTTLTSVDIYTRCLRNLMIALFPLEKVVKECYTALSERGYNMRILGTIIFNIRNMRKAKKYRTIGKEGLLALNDEDFYDAIECICEDAVYDIKDVKVTDEQKFVYSLNKFEAEVNNGGLCQFFVNSSSECAPYISDALATVGAIGLKMLFDNFISENSIDVNDLSSFKISNIDEYEAQTERFDFDGFDDKFYEDENLHQQIIDYARKHVEQLIVE